MDFDFSIEFARSLDAKDLLKEFRDKFFIPQINGRDSLYFNGNSLGLLPKAAESYLQQELKDWATLGGHGHFTGRNPWLTYHKMFKKPLSVLTGSLESEVVAMNSLTVNLHLLLASFYRPDKKRYKILIEKGAFSSDQYAVETQVNFHGYIPEDSIIEIGPRIGEHTIQTEDVLKTIDENKNELSLVLIGGVNFYTGQVFDMQTITTYAHKAGITVGFDLAHAIGNIELSLHQWEVDFAVWCSYKYLNSGPGGVGGAFVHEKHFKNKNIKRFGGWWGYLEEERFKMEKGFKPIEGVDGWQLSNVPILSMAVHKASLDIFMDAELARLRNKSKLLTGYLEFLLDDLKDKFKIITPSNPEERGCQLSLYFEYDVESINNKLSDAGVILDLRRPNVIRACPAPMYNTFKDVHEFYSILKKILEN